MDFIGFSLYGYYENFKFDIMTPKEKAKELFDKYCHAIRTEECDDGYFTNIIHAKRCSLIAVDEILNQFTWKPLTGYAFWDEVKQEIEKL